MSTLFIEPLDVLFLRGNKLFGDPGSHGESLIPPWPSVAAGAVRSRILADDKVDLLQFAQGKINHPQLGTPTVPGSFAITAFNLARRLADGSIEAIVAPPADCVISADEHGIATHVRLSVPTQPATGLLSSTPFAQLPVLAETTRGKPATGYWLTHAGWEEYLAGSAPHPKNLIATSELWAIDPRVGVGLNAETGSAEEGRLFSVQAVAMKPNIGFIAIITGATAPEKGSLRLGGDGRAAAICATETALPKPDYAAIAAARRCRLVLSTPGIFTLGWLPNGATQKEDGIHFELAGVTARIVCAAIPRAETVSGWDLAKWQPKPAQRAAPTGSVYWLEDITATAEALRKLVEHGLWSNTCEDASRRAEGFNRCELAL